MAQAAGGVGSAYPAGLLADVVADAVAILHHRRKLFREWCREPAVEEIVRVMGMPVERIAEVRKFRSDQDRLAGDVKCPGYLVAVGLAPDTIC